MSSALLVYLAERSVHGYRKQAYIVIEHLIVDIHIILEFACNSDLCADMSDFVFVNDYIKFSSVLACDIVGHILALDIEGGIEESRSALYSHKNHIIEDDSEYRLLFVAHLYESIQIILICIKQVPFLPESLFFDGIEQFLVPILNSVTVVSR